MKNLAILLLCVLNAMPSLAQSRESLPFTTIDWEQLSIDSILPLYTEVVPLESDYRQHDYSVSVEYPEYAPLSAKEALVALRFDSLISEKIRVESFVGVERGKGMLDIAFIPVVRKGDCFYKLTSGQIVITPTPATGRANARMEIGKKDRYVASSRLANGRWIKLSIQENGLYQLSRTMLTKLGFDPENVHLYGYGGHILPEPIRNGSHYDDMVEVPLYYNSQTDAWIFWGNGIIRWSGDTRIRNCYANSGYYFITEEAKPSAIETIPYSTTKPYKT